MATAYQGYPIASGTSYPPWVGTRIVPGAPTNPTQTRTQAASCGFNAGISGSAGGGGGVGPQVKTFA